MEIVTKSFESELLEADEGKREVVACVSSSSLDRDGEVVLASGLVKKHYGGSPFLWRHSKEPENILGQVLWAKQVGDKIVAKHRFSSVSEKAKELFPLVQEGTLRTFSVSFRPLEASEPRADEPQFKEASRIYRKWEMLESSLVPIPANADAVALAVSKGLVLGDELRRELSAGVNKDPKYQVHKAGVAQAERLIARGDIDRGGTWNPDVSSPGQDASSAAWKEFSLRFLAEDPTQPRDTLAHWHFPVVEGGKVFIHGLRAAIARAGQTGSADIEAAARRLLELAEKRSKQFAAVVARGAARRLANQI